MFSHICHLIMRYLEMCTCFCALSVWCGFRVLFCWEVFASLVSYGSYLCRLKSRNTCNHLIHDLKMIRVIPRGTKSKWWSSFLFLNADFWSSLFAVTCASIIVSADADKCIKIMRSLERLSFAQLPGITPQYLRGGTTWAWFRITALLAHSLSVTLHHSFRKMFYPPPPRFYLSSLVKLCAERCFMTNSKPWGSALCTWVEVGWMWTAVKWLVFLSNHSVCPHVGTHSRQGNVDFMEAAKVCFHLKWSAHFLTESELTVKTIGWHLCSITVDRYFSVMPSHTCALSGVSAVQLTEAQRGMDCDGQFSAPLWISLTGFNASPPSTVLLMCCHGQLTRFITFSNWRLMGDLCPRHRARSCRPEIDGSTEE